MTTPQPIQTEAFGRVFRSRTEARCAVFLERMGFQWEYEPEGYELPSGRYLPDFKVLDQTKLSGFYWIECKGDVAPTDQEVALARELSGATRAAVVFFNYKLLNYVRSLYLDFARYAKLDNEAGYGRPFDGTITYPVFVTPHMEDHPFGGVSWIQLWDRHSLVDKELMQIGLTEFENLRPSWPLSQAFDAANHALKARFEHGSGFA